MREADESRTTTKDQVANNTPQDQVARTGANIKRRSIRKQILKGARGTQGATLMPETKSATVQHGSRANQGGQVTFGVTIEDGGQSGSRNQDAAVGTAEIGTPAGGCEPDDPQQGYPEDPLRVEEKEIVTRKLVIKRCNPGEVNVEDEDDEDDSRGSMKSHPREESMI